MNTVFTFKERILLYTFLILFATGFVPHEAADYKIYVAAGRVIIDDHKNPYAEEDMIELEPDGRLTNHAQYRYAPIFGMALYPFSLLPKPIYVFLWLFLNAFLIVKTLLLFREFFPKLLHDKKAFLVTAFFSIALTHRFIGINFELGQTTPLLVFLSFYSLKLSRENKNITAGLMLAIAIIIKIMPLVLIVYFVFRGNIKTPIFAVLWTVFLVLLPVIFIGWDYNSYLIQEWYKIVSPASAEYALETKTGIINLSALIYSYFTAMPDSTVEGKRNILNLSYETAAIITNILRGMLISFTLYFTRWTPFKKQQNETRAFWEFGYISLIFPLIFPAQNVYSLFFLFPAAFYLSYYLYLNVLKKGSNWRTHKPFLVVLALYLALTHLTSANIVNRHMYQQVEFFKIVTFGIFILLISYTLIKPKMIINSKKDKDE
ncbi:MAG: DUF2029 domain-containing protein [Cytophagia bacterium]|nr:DUF2029 domain-containing protein [Cytophagia bacterium]